ncbi:MAG: peptide deformylase [Candidatus Wallbacteria bacterium]|nr:peptide deformylase [Candidatus Wallbacteria bacterium]
MEIKVYGNPSLRQKSEPAKITKEEINLAREMILALHEAKGVGLAAPQIGKNLRIIVMDLKEGGGEPEMLFNPEIYWTSDESNVYEEGCLSFPEITAEIERPTMIKYTYCNCQEQMVDRYAEGLEARVVQHEVDHLNAVLIIDHVGTTKFNLLKKRLRELKQTGASQK